VVEQGMTSHYFSTKKKVGAPHKTNRRKNMLP